jgi:hypothetical protein
MSVADTLSSVARVEQGLLSLASFEGGLRSLVMLNLFDALATLLWVRLGLATEANPVMAQALDTGPGLFILAKVMLVTLAVGLLWRLRGERLARLAAVPLGSLYAMVAGGHVGFGLLAGIVNLVPHLGF